MIDIKSECLIDIVGIRTVDESHLWRALRYVERNPVRAGMVWRAEEYAWSSARAHVVNEDDSGLLDLGWWRAHGPDGSDWAAELHRGEDAADLRRMEECTYADCPFGEEAFVREVGERYGRHWAPGRPERPPSESGPTEAVDFRHLVAGLQTLLKTQPGPLAPYRSPF